MSRHAIAAALLLVAACATDEPKYSASRDAAVQTDADAVYAECLRDSQMIAMAWEAIEEMCRERSGAKDPLAANGKQP